MANGDQSSYAAFVLRVMRAARKRYAAADPHDLVELLAIRTEVDATIAGAVDGLRTTGYSWAEIAAPLGMTRQAAQQRWGKR